MTLRDRTLREPETRDRKGESPMHIHRLDRDRCEEAYGILCHGAFPWQELVDPPFGSSWCVVEPGKSVRAHKHQEHEVFFIARGRGVMTVDGESEEVRAGDTVLMEPFQVHEVTNSSETEDLVILDVLWERMGEASRANREDLGVDGASAPADVLVTATPPTPNGDLHVGHLSGPYLGADFHARYLRMHGADARYLTGSDDHQSYVDVLAASSGETRQGIAERFADAIEATLSAASVEVSHFARPRRSRHHRRLVRELFARLHEQGDIVAREAPTLYCEACSRFLFEGHVQGLCPHCGEGCDGNVCEACGRPNDCVDLIDPRCRHCGEEPGSRLSERFYFLLSNYEERLQRYYRTVQMGPHLASLCAAMLRDGMPDVAVSQVSDWGIPVPVDGFEGQSIFVWLEMAPGYLAAAEDLAENDGGLSGWRDLWASVDRDVIQFFGFDNGYFHAVLFPALYMAFDPEVRLPRAFVTNEFYRYEGSKFSTSRAHALWARELLDLVPADQARFYLAYDRPETAQSDFRLEELQRTVQRELVEGWDAWLRDLGETLHTEFDARVPGTGAWTGDHQRFYGELERLTAEAAAGYEAASFSPQRAARALGELVRRTRRFAWAQRSWAGLTSRFEERRTAVALEVLAAKTLALLAAPLMPDFAARLWRDLGFEGRAMRWEWQPEPVPGGQRVGGLDGTYFSAPVERLDAVAGESA